MIHQVQVEARGVRPVPKGALRSTLDGRLFWSNSSRLDAWREYLALCINSAVTLTDGAPLYRAGVPIRVGIKFYFQRPKSHGDAERRHDYHVYVPDIDKLIRAVLDELSGVVFPDDRQVVEIQSSKYWVETSEEEGASISVLARTPSEKSPEYA